MRTSPVFARLRDERGIALVMAIGIMMTLTVLATSVAYYATSNSTAAGQSGSRASAYDLAEAGINAALAKLNGQLDTDGSVLPGGTDPRSPSLFSTPVILNYPTLHGTATYSGTIVTTTDPMVWTITSVGTVTSSGKSVSRTLTRTASVRGLNDGANAVAWSRFYQDDPTHCLTIDTVNMTAAIATRGNLCLVNGGTITGSTSSVDVGGNVTITGPGTTSQKAGVSGTGWTNPTNIASNNSSYATASVATNANSATMTATGLGFAIPSTAIVLGISVDVDRRGPSGTSNVFKDQTIQLLKAGTAVGSNYANTSTYWGTSDSTRTYGAANDLWGTTWTAADVNNANFGLKLIAKNYNGSTQTANVDYVSVTVTYTNDTNALGTSGTPLHDVNVNGTCKYNAATAHTPCSSADKVYATDITTQGQDLEMPQVDFNYWWANSKPGPKHFCTNANPGLSSSFFDNNANSTSAPDHSIPGNGEVTPPNSDYTCQVVENGVIVGELSWNHTTHVLKILGTVFVDGDFRFDDDGDVVHYQGRGIIYTSGDVEFDEFVCSGGSGTSNCLSTMSNWNPAVNMLVLLSQGDSEYDQGGSSCSPTGTTTCPNGHLIGGFQGVVYALGSCIIHEKFYLSGPVVCNRIDLPYESDGWPTYYPYPALTNLVDGQKYSSTSTASNFELLNGSQSG